MKFKKNAAGAMIICLAVTGPGADIASRAQGIEQLLLERVPIPTRRPDGTPAASPRNSPSTVANTVEIAQAATPVSGAATKQATVIPGSLRSGLDALGKKDSKRALGIRAGLPAGSLDRKILAWAIALSGQPDVSSADIAKIARDLPDWPGQLAMRNNAENALVRENLSANAIIRAFAGQKPASVTGAILLAKAHLDTGNKRAANAVIAPFWRKENLDKASEEKLLSRVGRALTRADHRFRMHRQFYRDRTRAANRAAKYAGQASLAKARTAVIRRSPKAGKLLKAVAATSRKDPGYLFARIQQARRSDNYQLAARLIQKAPDTKSPARQQKAGASRRMVGRAAADLSAHAEFGRCTYGLQNCCGSFGPIPGKNCRRRIPCRLVRAQVFEQPEIRPPTFCRHS